MNYKKAYADMNMNKEEMNMDEMKMEEIQNQNEDVIDIVDEDGVDPKEEVNENQKPNWLHRLGNKWDSTAETRHKITTTAKKLGKGLIAIGGLVGMGVAYCAIKGIEAGEKKAEEETQELIPDGVYSYEDNGVIYDITIADNEVVSEVISTEQDIDPNKDSEQ